MRKDFVWNLKNFFGIFVLTEFEFQLLEFLCRNSDENTRNILRRQIDRFNFVNRILDSSDPELPYGFTDFYYKRRGTILRSPQTLADLEEVEEHVLMECLAEDADGARIRCSFVAVRGVLFEIQYRSTQRRWHPIGSYSLTLT